ncbi:MAG: glycosyltransferase family 2 protein [Gammaproteobacteria bacterium]|nr:glycosyltransferase family 2 protein [Gammaproteobacteria bacterium]
MARFAVCIPVYNGGAFVGQALESIAEQTLEGVEVLVSDNASTDDTAHILAEWSDRLPMRVIRRPQTLPMLDHFNALLDEVNSDAYMLLCDDDYLASPDALAKARAALDANPQISAVYCDLLYVNEHRRPLGRRRFGRDGLFTAADAGRRSLRSGRNCFGIPLAIRREALGALRYDSHFLYLMDLDLSWSISSEKPAFHIAEPLIANRYSRRNSTWGMLKTARHEYVALASKYVGPPNWLQRSTIAATSFQVTLRKRLFSAYERLLTRMT